MICGKTTLFPRALALLGFMMGSSAQAAATMVRGKILVTPGHEQPDCRMVQLKRNDNGNIIWFRIGSGGSSDIMAVTLTAVTTKLDVEITYDPALTSGCGTEPRILFIALFALS